jgi:hypothetical protein
LPLRSQVILEPRESPVQARSAANVDAILDATIQVSRRMLESGAAERQVEALRRELTFMACAYVDACVLGDADEGLRSGVLDAAGQGKAKTGKGAAHQQRQ